MILAHIDVAKSIIREPSIQSDQVNSQDNNANEYVWMYSQTILERNKWYAYMTVARKQALI